MCSYLSCIINRKASDSIYNHFVTMRSFNSGDSYHSPLLFFHTSKIAAKFGSIPAR